MRRNRLIATGAASLFCGLAALGALALGAPKPTTPPPAAEQGQVKINLSKTSDVLDFQNAVIGDTTQGTVTVSNGGKLAAEFRLSGLLQTEQSTVGATALANQLQLSVYKTFPSAAETLVYTGSISNFNTQSFNLGTLYPPKGSLTPKSVNLRFKLEFPTTGDADGDNALQNLGPFDERFVIDAAQRASVAGSINPDSSSGTERAGALNSQDTAQLRSSGLGSVREVETSAPDAVADHRPATDSTTSAGDNLRDTSATSPKPEASKDSPGGSSRREDAAPQNEVASKQRSHAPESVGVATAGNGEARSSGLTLTTVLAAALTILAGLGLLFTLPTTSGRIR